MNAGTLELQLMANIARLQQDMSAATQLVQSSSAKMASDLGDIKKSIESSLAPLQSLTVKFGSLESQIDRAQSAAVSLGKGLLLGAAAGMSIDAIKNKILGVIDGMANLKTLSEKTGSSVENLSKLAFFGKQSGTDIDAITSALGKMSKGMAGADDETKGAGAALKYLGISAKDASGNLKDPSAMFTEIAGKLANYSDGAGKAAIAQALFGKSGADMLPTLKLIAEQGDIEAKVTDAQATAARQYQRDLAKLDAQKGQLFKTIAVSLLPTMTDFAAVLLDAAKKTNITNDAAKSLAKDNSITDWADAGAMGLARLLDVFLLIPKTATAVIGSFKAVAADLTVLQTLSPSGINAAVAQGKNPIAEFKAALDERNKVLAQSNANYDALWNAEGNRFEKAMAAAIAKRKDAAKEVAATPALAPLNYSSVASTTSDNAYKAYLAKQDGLYKLEEDGLAAHLQALESQHARALIGDVQYLDQRHAAEQQALADEIAIRQRELAAAQKDPATNAKDIEKYAADIAQLKAKGAQLDAADAERRLTLEHTTQQTIEGIDVEAMKKRGDLVGAFSVDFSKRYMDMMTKAQLDGNTELQAAIERAWKAGLSEANFSQTKQQFDSLFSSMNNDIQQVQDTAGANGGLVARINAAGVADSIRDKAIPALQDYVAQMQALAAASGNDALVRQANDMARALTQQIQKVQPVWSDMIKSIDDTFESGLEASMSKESGAWSSFVDGMKNTFKKNLIDEIYQMFLKPFVMQIVISGANSLGLSGLASAASLAGGGGGSGGAAGISSLLQAGKGAYDAITTGFAGVGDSIASGVQAGLSYFGYYPSAASGLATAGGQALTPLAAGAGTVGSIAAGAGLGYLGGTLISGQYGSKGTVIGGTAVGAAIGSIVPGLGTAIGAALGGVLGGIANRLFGMGDKEITSRSVQGTLTGSDFSGQNVANWHQDGGWFRSDKNGTDTSAVDATTSKAFTDAYASIRSISGALATTLGVDASSLATRSQALNIAITGDATKDQQAVTDFFNGVADTIAAELVPGLATFQAQGETLSATLQRVSTDYAATTLVLSTLGSTAQKAFGVTGVAAIGASEQLIKAAGGLDALNSGTTYFAQNFLTPAQQIAPIVDSVKASLAALGLAGVDTNEKFAAAVLDLTQSGKLATAEGAAQYAALLALAPQFKQATDYTDGMTNALGGLIEVTRSASDIASERADLQKQLDQYTLTSDQLAAQDRAAIDQTNVALYDQVQAQKAAAQAMTDATAAGDSALTQLQNSVNAQKTAVQAAADAQKAALQMQEDAANATLQSVTSILSTLDSAISSAQAAQTLTLGVRGQAMDTITSILQQVQKGASLADVGGDNSGLSQAISTLAQPSTDLYGSFVDYARDQAKANNTLTALQKAAGGQVSLAQATVDRLSDAVKAVDDQTTAELARLDKLVTDGQAALDVAKGTNTTLLSLNAAIVGLAAAIASIGATKTATSGGTAPPTDSSVDASIGGLYQSLLGRGADSSGLAYWEQQYASGASLAQIANGIASSDEYKALHPFAVGTNFIPTDMPAMVHKGERIIPAADNRALMARLQSPAGNSDALLEEVKNLRTTVEKQRTALEKVATSTAQLSDMYERNTANGGPALVQVVS